MTRIAHVSMKLVMPVGFSNGCAEFVLKNPPPLVPSCLMAIWLATGPPGIDWLAVWRRRPASTGVAVGVAGEVLHDAAERRAGWRRRTTAAAGCAASCGSRSTQKLPSVRRPRRMMPRMIAMATAMPAAADTKFCTASPTIWVRWLIVSSPLYHCQLVLVMKLTATLNAPSGGDRRHVRRVERQRALEALQDVDGQERHEAEREQGDRVDVPALLAARVDAQQR